jgi:predicted ferric reductase
MTLIMFFTAIGPVRKRIPYEVFYYTHHIFVPLYVIAILHTIDVQVRFSSD